MANPNNNPCYDKETKTDCPRRHAGCAVDCPEWAKYSEERAAEYKKRAENHEIEYTLHKNAMARSIFVARRALRDRARKK